MVYLKLMIKAVILDLDETLSMTEEVSFRMENEALKRMGLAPMSRAVHKDTWGMPLMQAIHKRSPGVDTEKFKKLHTKVLAEFVAKDQIDVFSKENINAIDQLILQDKKVIILTSRDHLEVQHLLSPTNILAGRIESFYYKDNMQYHKPDPRAFEHIEAKHGWLPEESVCMWGMLYQML